VLNDALRRRNPVGLFNSGKERKGKKMGQTKENRSKVGFESGTARKKTEVHPRQSLQGKSNI